MARGENASLGNASLKTVPGPDASAGARTRVRLLEVGERLFGAAGIEATPTRQICREAGVHQDAIHYHFGTKDQFVAAILEAGIDRLDQRLAARLAEAGEAGEAGESGEGASLASLARAAVAATADMASEEGVGRHYLPFIVALLSDPRLRPLATSRSSAWGERMLSALTPLTPALPDVERTYRVAIVGFLLIHVLGAGPGGGLIGQWLAAMSVPTEDAMRGFLVDAVVGVLGGPRVEP
jgi:AcrR family transcriptional regulator